MKNSKQANSTAIKSKKGGPCRNHFARKYHSPPSLPLLDPETENLRRVAQHIEETWNQEGAKSPSWWDDERVRRRTQGDVKERVWSIHKLTFPKNNECKGWVKPKTKIPNSESTLWHMHPLLLHKYKHAKLEARNLTTKKSLKPTNKNNNSVTALLADPVLV